MISRAPTLAGLAGAITRNPLAEPAASYQRVAVAALVPGAALAAALLWKTGIRLNFDLGIYVTLITLLLAGGALGLVGENTRLRNFATSFAVLSFATLCAGTISHASLALQRPLVDAQLLAADRALGIDTPTLIIALSRKTGLMIFLDQCYSYSKLMIILTISMLSIRRKSDRLWEMSALYSCCVLISASIFVIYPAIGVFYYSGIYKIIGRNLPNGSGVYFIPAFMNYYYHKVHEITFGNLSGVVAFPSFHMAMALTIAYAWRKVRILNILVLIYSLFVVISCLPIGGHYVADLLGGLIVWSSVLWLVKAYARKGASKRPVLLTGLAS